MTSKKQIVVVGLGRFGSSLARTLCELGNEVLALDRSPEAVNDIAECVTQAAQLDATSEEALKELGVRNFDMGVVSIGEDIKSSILITLLLKKLGVRWVVSKATDDLHAEILQRVGADRVVYPERETGVRLAHGLAVPGVVDYLKVVPGYGISIVAAPAAMAGKSLSDLNLKGIRGLSIVLLARGSQVILSPSRDELVQQGDLLVLAGRDDGIEMIGQMGIQAVAIR